MEEGFLDPDRQSGRDGFIMDFNFDVVDEVTRQSTIGYFKAARDMSKDTLEHHMEIFPITVEVLRLLYGQGEVLVLQSMIRLLLAHGESPDDQSI